MKKITTTVLLCASVIALMTEQSNAQSINRIAKFTGFLNTVTNSQIFDNGNVGVNTGTPAFKLDVNGNGRYTSTLRVGAYTLPATDGTNGQVLKTNGSGILTWMNDNTATYTAGTGISIVGNVITNTAPNQVVSITGSGGTTVMGSYPSFTISSTNSTYTGGTGISISGNVINSVWTASGNNIFNNNTANVGIGNSSPSSKLDVTGDINTSNDYKIGESTILSTARGSLNIGYSAGLNNISSGGGAVNVFIGIAAGNQNTNGIDNTFIGYSSGALNTSGQQNTFLGNNSGPHTTTGNLNTFVGSEAGFSNTGGTQNNFFGVHAGQANTTGFANVCIGAQAGLANTTGGQNIYIGDNANASGPSNLNNSVAIGANSLVTASNCFVLGAPTISGMGMRVGIGTSAPGYQLELSTDNAAKPGSNTWIIASDRRLKKDIEPFKDGLAVLKKINPVWFKYNGEANTPTDKKYVGVIAQEMKEIIPYTVGTFKHTDSKSARESEYLNYDGNAMTYILINSIKEQQQMIDALEQRLAQLEAANKPSGIKNTQTEIMNYNALNQNIPNPFDKSTTIGYQLKEAGNVDLTVYSITGQVMAKLVNQQQNAGAQNVVWDSNEAPSGTYIYVLKVNGQELIKKAILKK